MKPLYARAILVVLLGAWVGLLCVSPVTRDYTVQSFSAGDGAYHFFDDFIAHGVVHGVWLWYAVSFACVMFIFMRYVSRYTLSFIRACFGALCCGAIASVWWGSVFACVLFCVIVLYPWHRPQLLKKQEIAIPLFLFFIALLFRLEKLPDMIGHPLHPDAFQYLRLSGSMSWWYDTLHREPLWAWVNKCMTCIFTIPETVIQTGYMPIRFLTVLLSSGVVVMTYRVGRRVSSHNVAFCAAVLVAINKSLIYRSVQGLRLELITLGILYVLFLFIDRERWLRHQYRWSVIMGIVCGLLLLTKTTCLLFVVIMIILLWIMKRNTLYGTILTVDICALIAVPYYMYCAHTFGDPLYSASYHLNIFYYMTQFDHYETQLAHLPFITAKELLFSIYPWQKTAVLLTEGMFDIVFGRFAFRIMYVPFSVCLIGCSLVGYARWFMHPQQRIFVMVLCVTALPLALPLAMLRDTSVMPDWRLVAHLAPFIALAAAEGMIYLFGCLGNEQQTKHMCCDA